MFKNYSNCERCIHASVCSYKLTFKEVYDKINEKWDSLNSTNIFRLELSCNQYNTDKPRQNGGFLC